MPRFFRPVVHPAQGPSQDFMGQSALSWLNCPSTRPGRRCWPAGIPGSSGAAFLSLAHMRLQWVASTGSLHALAVGAGCNSSLAPSQEPAVLFPFPRDLSQGISCTFSGFCGAACRSWRASAHCHITKGLSLHRGLDALWGRGWEQREEDGV